MTRFMSVLLLVLLSSNVRGAPPHLPERNITLEVRAAPVDQLFKLLGELAQRPVALDACVQGAVDITLRNSPQAVVWDALAQKLQLTYRERSGTIHVGCRSDPARVLDATTLNRRISIEVREVKLKALAELLATLAGLEGADVPDDADATLSLALNGVRLQTAMAAVEDATGCSLQVLNNRLVAERAAPPR